MSKKNRPLLSLRGEANVPTTERIAQPPADPNAPIVETTMPSAEEQTVLSTEQMKAEAVQEPTGPTAKEMAAAEEANAARAAAIIRRQQEQVQRDMEERPTLIGVAAQGMDALHEAIRAANAAPVVEYVPPPRTERQMAQLEAELNAGRAAQLRAQAQQANRPPPPKDPNEGFTTPVHRPDDMVPHPLGGLKPIVQ